MPGAAATLRIARRDAWRHKGRSALIIAMVAIPVLGLTAADVLARTMQLNAGERLARQIGQADIGLRMVGGQVSQNVDPTNGYSSRHGRPLHGPALARAQAAALRLVGAEPATATVLDTEAVAAANGRRVAAELIAVSLRDPMTAGIASVVAGRAPRGPSEVGLTPPLASRLGASVGTTVDVAGRPETVTGLVRNPNDLRATVVYGDAVSPLDRRHPQLLARTDQPVTWPEVTQLNAAGFVVTSRSVIEHPPAGAPVTQGVNRLVSQNRVGVATVAVGLGVLEVMLLAGAAFAVGARRQRRNLALLAATGGDAGQVGQVVLGGGLVLGVVGGVLGVGTGLVTGRLALPEIAHLAERSPGHFDLRPIELLAVLLIGVVTGLLASVLPARSAARDDALSALTGRRGQVRSPRRVVALGLTMIVVGALVAVRSAHRYHFNEILAGAVISEIGFVLCSPAVIGFVGRAARRLPLAPRLALRDAARHRGRSGPAVAAVMAAIAGSIAVSTYFVSTVERDRQNYVPQGRIGQPVLDVAPGGPNAAEQRAASFAATRRILAASRLVPVPTAVCVDQPKSCTTLYLSATDSLSPDVAIGGTGLLRALTGRTDPGAERALAGGHVVEFSRASQPIQRDGRNASATVHDVSPYLDDVGRTGTAVAGIMSTATAAKIDAPSSVSRYLVITRAAPSQQQVDRLDAELPLSSSVSVERGYAAGRYSAGVVVLAIAAGIVTLGATAVSVGLSMAESKPDLITLAAVGARPRTRRLLVANQAGVVALLGALQGVVAGLIPAWAILHAAHNIPFVLPWTTIVITVVGIPTLAMIGTAAFAGSGLTLDRRAT
jgi:putative ABC transport system permease protein